MESKVIGVVDKVYQSYGDDIIISFKTDTDVFINDICKILDKYYFRITRILFKEDYKYRVKGEEFTLIFFETTIEDDRIPLKNIYGSDVYLLSDEEAIKVCGIEK